MLLVCPADSAARSAGGSPRSTSCERGSLPHEHLVATAQRWARVALLSAACDRARLSRSAACAAGGVWTDRPCTVQATHASKMDAVTREFTHLLTSQLESQRAWFEDLRAQDAAQHSARIAELDAAGMRHEREIASLQQRCDSAGSPVLATAASQLLPSPCGPLRLSQAPPSTQSCDARPRFSRGS